MKILKQPSGYNFRQPLLNKFLRVHVSLSYSARNSDTDRVSWFDERFYDSKTRKELYSDNWRVKLIHKLGT